MIRHKNNVGNESIVPRPAGVTDSKPAKESLYGQRAVKWSPLHIRHRTFPAPAFAKLALMVSSGEGSGSEDLEKKVANQYECTH